MNDTILVPGATGALGSALVKQLAEKGVRVRAGVHTPSKADSIRSKNVEVVPLDLDNPEDVDRAVRGVTKILLLTPPLSPTQVEIAANVLEVAVAEGVRHVVRLSFLGADRKESGTLGALSLQVEKLVRESGIPFTCLRPPGFMQNLLTSMRPQNGAIYAPAAESKNSLVDAADVAAVAVAAFTEKGHDGRVYEPTGPAALSYGEVAAILSEATGKDINYVAVTEEATREAMTGQGAPEHVIQGVLELMALQRSGYVATVTTDVEDVAHRTPTSFADFAKVHASEF